MCNLVDLYEHSVQSATRAFRSFPSDLAKFTIHQVKALYAKWWRDGADAETVVCALFHDVGEVLNHVNHGEIGESDADDGHMSKDSGGGKEGLVIGNKSAAASLLRPYISEQNYWVLQHHEVIIMMIYGPPSCTSKYLALKIFIMRFQPCRISAIASSHQSFSSTHPSSDLPNTILRKSLWCRPRSERCIQASYYHDIH